MLEAGAKSHRATLQATAAALAGAAVLQALASRGRDARANSIGSAVCVIAFLHYTWMRDAPPLQQLELRFSDWFVTCPLLLFELYSATGETQGAPELLAALGCVVAMLGLGFAASHAERPVLKYALFAAGCVAFAAAIYSFMRELPSEHVRLTTAFFALWSLYPVAFLLESNTMFDLLDMASKAGIGFYVAHHSLAPA